MKIIKLLEGSELLYHVTDEAWYFKIRWTSVE